MPEAIATSKRKFYKALDSLHNPPTTRPAEPAAKRARRSTSTTSTITHITAAHKADDAPKQPPNFSPWSRETFLARLKTFGSVSLWHPKPEAIGEVEWAKRGWRCVDVNTVACKGGCEKRVVVSLDAAKQEGGHGDDDGAKGPPEVDDDDEDEDESGSMYEDGLVGRYQKLIADGHASTCMWHKNGCKDDIYHLQVVRPSVWQPELRKRYQSLRAVDGAIAQLKIVTALPHDDTTASSITPENPNRLADALEDLLLGQNDYEPASEASAGKTLEIALHGWRGAKDSGNELLHCDACFQRIGLWMYQPGYRSLGTTTSSDDDNDTATTVVDLVELHRDHCPWRNASTQLASGSLRELNASQILQRVVSTYAREQRRKSDDRQKTARQVEAEDEADEEPPASPAPSRDELAKQDNERESRLKKLKSLFTIKRRGTVKPTRIADLAK